MSQHLRVCLLNQISLSSLFINHSIFGQPLPFPSIQYSLDSRIFLSFSDFVKKKKGIHYLESKMKIQCDVCEKAPATLICCADEAALCAKCDVEIHAANRLASKHQRLLLQSFSTKLPLCDICREKTAFIFCVEDRALFCHDCDEPIHSANTRAANHQRFLATGVRVALSSSSKKDSIYKLDEPQPPAHNTSHHLSFKTSLPEVSNITTPSWSVDELLHLSECENSISDKKETLEFGGGLDWLTDISLFGEHMAHEEALTTAEVPQLPVTQSIHGSYRTPRYSMPYKKARLELPIDDDDEYFTVPDLG